MDGMTISKFVIAGTILVLGLLEVWGGLYIESKRSRNDFTLEFVSLVTLPVFIQPAIFLVVVWLMEQFTPGLQGRFAEAAIALQVLAFLVFDDMMQYWWHRWSHVNPTLWKLHRPHHLVEEMGVLVTYRNAVLYYALMPGIWFSAALVFLGMGPVYMVYLPVKLVVILLAHSETRWDRFLYRHRILHPIAWVVERTISTPATHFAHHGLSASDGVSHPNGNFGNLLFFWDVLFGTAKITRKYPTTFGAWNRTKEPWYVQLLFPLIRSNDPESELRSLGAKNAEDEAVTIDGKDNEAVTRSVS